MEAAQDAARAQAPQSFEAGGGGEPDQLGELLVGHPRILL